MFESVQQRLGSTGRQVVMPSELEPGSHDVNDDDACKTPAKPHSSTTAMSQGVAGSPPAVSDLEHTPAKPSTTVQLSSVERARVLAGMFAGSASPIETPPRYLDCDCP